MGKYIFWLISPDAAFCAGWENAFKKEGWEVRVCASPREFNSKYHGEKGVLLAEVPDHETASPQKFFSAFRKTSGVTITAFASAGKITPRQVAKVLNSAADFVPKEIDIRILKLKLKTYIPRPTLTAKDSILRSKDGSVRIDADTRVVRICCGPRTLKEIDCLTPKEFGILTLLISFDGQCVQRDLLLDRIWGKKAEIVNAETVDKHIESLRKKLGATGRHIQTVYGSGYAYMGI